MGLFDNNSQPAAPVPGPAPAPVADPAIVQAENNCINADKALSDALKSLGEACFEANKDAPDPEYSEKISVIKKCMEKAKLCRQYRLHLEDKALCENCGAVITADSLFCNKCGSKMPALDFSALNVCPSCGRSFAPGSSFCEMCGYRLG